MRTILFNEGPQGSAIVTDSTAGYTVIRGSGAATTALSYDSAMASEGGFGYNNTVTNNVAVLRVTSDATSNQQALSIYYRTPSVGLDSGATVTFGTVRHSGGVAARLQLKSDGTLQVGDANNAFIVAVAAGTIKWNTFYRFEWILTSGSTTAGVYQLRVYDANDTLLGTAATTTANLSVNPLTVFDLGNQGGLSSAVTMGYDAVRVEANRTTEIGPYVPVSYTVDAGADKANVEPYDLVILTGTDTATGTQTRAWTQRSGASVTLRQSGASADFDAPGTLAGATLTFQYAVGATVDTVNVAVLPVTERAVVGGAEVPMRLVSVVQET